MGGTSSYVIPDHYEREKIIYNRENYEQRRKENELIDVVNSAVKQYNSGCFKGETKVMFPKENSYCDKLNEILEGKVASCEIVKASSYAYDEVYHEVGYYMSYSFK